MTKSIQAKFHAEMLALYDHCAGFGFRPVLFRRLVILKGGVEAARELVFKPGTTGLERLIEAGKAEASMEAAMVRAEYRALFARISRTASSVCARRGNRIPSAGPFRSAWPEP